MKGPSKTIDWKGWFDQAGQKTDMEFNNLQMDFFGHLKGEGQDSIGNFTIIGQLKLEGSVSFKKIYEGQHTVNYQGEMDHDHVIKGKWEIVGNCDGQFEIKMVCENWTGTYTQDGTATDMHFDLKIDRKSVFGLGTDIHGFFVLKGYYDHEAEIVTFEKRYHGGNNIYYTGVVAVEQNGLKKEVEGTWHIPGNCDGEFHFKMERK